MNQAESQGEASRHSEAATFRDVEKYMLKGDPLYNHFVEEHSHHQKTAGEPTVCWGPVTSEEAQAAGGNRNGSRAATAGFLPARLAVLSSVLPGDLCQTRVICGCKFSRPTENGPKNETRMVRTNITLKPSLAQI